MLVAVEAIVNLRFGVEVPIPTLPVEGNVFCAWAKPALRKIGIKNPLFRMFVLFSFIVSFSYTFN